MWQVFFLSQSEAPWGLFDDLWLGNTLQPRFDDIPLSRIWDISLQCPDWHSQSNHGGFTNFIQKHAIERGEVGWFGVELSGYWIALHLSPQPNQEWAVAAVVMAICNGNDDLCTRYPIIVLFCCHFAAMWTRTFGHRAMNTPDCQHLWSLSSFRDERSKKRTSHTKANPASGEAHLSHLRFEIRIDHVWPTSDIQIFMGLYVPWWLLFHRRCWRPNRSKQEASESFECAACWKGLHFGRRGKIVVKCCERLCWWTTYDQLIWSFEWFDVKFQVVNRLVSTGQSAGG